MIALVTAVAGGVVVLAVVMRAARAGSRGASEPSDPTDGRQLAARLVLAAALAWLLVDRLLPLLGSAAWAGAAMLGYFVAQAMEAPRAEP